MEIERGSTESHFLGTRFGIDCGPVVRLRENEPTGSITEVAFMCEPQSLKFVLLTRETDVPNPQKAAYLLMTKIRSLICCSGNKYCVF